MKPEKEGEQIGVDTRSISGTLVLGGWKTLGGESQKAKSNSLGQKA